MQIERIRDKTFDPEAELKLDWHDIFHVKTIDGILYEFDAETGKVHKKKPSEMKAL